MTIDCTIPIGQVNRPSWSRPVGAGGRAMLDLILRRKTAVQAALPRELDLSQPSVARLVGGFVADGAMRTVTRAATGRGNPSVSLELVPDYAYGIGVGIAGDALSMALVDFAGTVRMTRRVALADMNRTAIVAQLASMLADILSVSNIDPSRLIGAGVGFSGFFVGAPPRFNPPSALADWVDIDLLETLSPVLGSNLFCDNDATCAAIAECLLGVGRTTQTFAYCHLSNGFGGGLIVDGQPMRGALGNAGDFGAVWWLMSKIQPGGGYPSLDRLHTLVAAGGATFSTVEDMLTAITPSTPGVDEWLIEAREPFATLAFLLGHIVAPEKIIIGGRIPYWLATALAQSLKLPTSPTRHNQPFPLPVVVASELQGDAAAIGAALMPFRSLFFHEKNS